MRQPTMFVTHGGGPMPLLASRQPNAYPMQTKLAKFMQSASGLLPERPKAIVIITAHWVSSEK
jgi:aromatic ring-opening dioxygenase catalytic subunit (LigB family)